MRHRITRAPQTLLDSVVQRFEHGDATETLLLGCDDIPRPKLVARLAEEVFGGHSVVVIAFTIAPVFRRELPTLERI